ncbi:MAG: DUF4956 domain-containing protein [Eubacteriales bacterium]
MIEKIFGTIFEIKITPFSFFICLFSSIIIGFFIALTFMYKNRYTKSFVITLVIIPAVVDLLIMIVNGNIGTGIAVAGAFSLVRFRSVQGNAREIGFIFMATAVGIAIGAGYVGVAFIFAAVLIGVTLLLNSTRFGEPKSADRELRITIPESLDYTTVFDDIFEKYTHKTELLKVRTTNLGSLYRLYYSVLIKDVAKEKEFLDEIRVRNGNLDIICAKVPIDSNETL